MKNEIVKTKNLGGRPTKYAQRNKKISQALSKMNDKTVTLLRQAFSIDATVEEACFHAGITPPTFYNWKKSNSKVFNELEALRNNPVLKARKTVVNSLDNPDNAFKYLERKRRNEFSTRTEIENPEQTEAIKTVGDIIKGLSAKRTPPVKEIEQSK